jgi:hypothetical protein
VGSGSIENVHMHDINMFELLSYVGGVFFNPCSEAAVSFSDVGQLTARTVKFVYNTALEFFIRSVF